MENTTPPSHASKIRQAAAGDLPLFHRPADHGGLDAVARSFNTKRWPSFTEHGDIEMKTEKAFRKGLLIRQMEECLEHAPPSLRESPTFDAAQAALLEYKVYSKGTHPSTHLGHKNWSGILQKSFLDLARESGKLCGPEQLVAAARIDNAKAASGNYPLWDKIDRLPRQIKKAELIEGLKEDIVALDRISTIDKYHERRDAYGRWLGHIEKYQGIIDKFSPRADAQEESLRARLEGNAYKVRPINMLTSRLILKQVADRAEAHLFSTHPTMEHCLVDAYRNDRKGCKVQGFAPYDFTSLDARDSAVMDVVYAARWGALADRVAMTLQAESVNMNRSSIATALIMPKVDAMLEQKCGLPPRMTAQQRS